MEYILKTFDFFVHLDVYLGDLINKFGDSSYYVLMAVIFAETGFVVTPFLPGDSLLFAAGAFSSVGYFDVIKLWFLLLISAILGDNTNYWIGRFVGRKILNRGHLLFINPGHINKTKEYFKRHGGKTIFIARFVPIVRTFAPFVAGIGHMTYLRFLKFSLFGGLVWISIFVFGGYYFGNINIVKNNFSIVALVIILISLLPVFYEYIKNKK